MARARTRKFSEFSAISEIEQIFDGAATRRLSSKPSASHFGSPPITVNLGIGDDAAVFSTRAKSKLVWTVDSAIEHVHFERAWLSLADLGWRSFQAAASDVCAMGGTPCLALSSIVFPRGMSEGELAQIARGQNQAARALGCLVIGGNLARGSELGITTTVIGHAARPILRSGAKPGDELWLCGEVGLSAAGLRSLQRGSRARSVAARRALAAFRRPAAQLEAGLALVGRARAAIDISDGLCGDAAHIAAQSRAKIVISTPLLARALSVTLRTLAPSLGVTALELALYGGEDYALLATGPARARPKRARVIGWVTGGAGVWLSAETEPAQKSRQRLERAPGGFEHSGGRPARRMGR